MLTKFNERGISPVVAAVLLLVITVVAGALIMSFVLPFVKQNLDDSGGCLEVLEGIEFAQSQFNCFDDKGNSNPLDDETGFSVKINHESVDGFRVGLIDSSGSSTVYTITSDNVGGSTVGTSLEKIRMVGSGASGYGAALKFPDIGGQRSYVANAEYSEAEISPVLIDGDVCSVTDRVDFEPCGESIP
jgi:flagellin-like protein